MVKSTAPDWTHWRHVNKCALWVASILTVDVDPDLFGIIPADGRLVQMQPGSVDSLVMKVIDSHVRIAISHIGSGFSYDGIFPPDDRKQTRVSLPNFGRWAATIWPDLPVAFPRQQPWQPPATEGWPWGAYETPLLKELAAAVQHFWTNYKPESAPTKEQVVDWLTKRGRTLNEATAIAKIIRPPDLPDGPRVKRDKRNG